MFFNELNRPTLLLGGDVDEIVQLSNSQFFRRFKN
jgi:hypothetical protein